MKRNQATTPSISAPLSAEQLRNELENFNDFGTSTVVGTTIIGGANNNANTTLGIPTFTNEFWTAKQREAHSLHEVSYRACFKPQLPRFFISRLTQPGDTVYDPYMGRGTTLLESALNGRIPLGCDINPLSCILIAPRLDPPSAEEIHQRLEAINVSLETDIPEELLVFYQQDTLREICCLRNYFSARDKQGELDNIDRWIRMVAITRLTGHSPGFFSVYSLPPNQAITIESQKRINERLNQKPAYRDTKDLIWRKSLKLLKDCTPSDRANLQRVAQGTHLVTSCAQHTPSIADSSVALAVTSPPFLNIVNYAKANWLRCWFVNVDVKSVPITSTSSPAVWSQSMTDTMRELRRVLRSGGHLAFEVGEVSKGTVKLEEAVLQCGVTAGLTPILVLINSQAFTKTANCWGVANNNCGTNTNRIVLFRKE